MTVLFCTVLHAADPYLTLVGTGVAGYSETQVSNPYGMAIGPDGGLYFCDLDNQRIRRIDLKTKHMTTIAGDGQKGYRGDGGPALQASLNMPHELRFDAKGDIYIAERDNHVIRKIDMKTGLISTVAGTGVAGFSGDGGPGTKAQLRQPHSIFFDRDGTLLICDIGNQRVRRLHLDTGVIETWLGGGEPALRGPRTLAMSPNGDLFLALREGNQILRIDAGTKNLHVIAGTGEQGYTGDGGPAVNAKLSGPKGLTWAAGDKLYIADTESHTIRVIDLKSGIISTVIGTGVKGELNRPHGVLFADGVLYVTDSENNRILTVKPR
jgi:sugar lactone lactonase YvrE